MRENPSSSCSIWAWVATPFDQALGVQRSCSIGAHVTGRGTIHASMARFHAGIAARAMKRPARRFLPSMAEEIRVKRREQQHRARE